MNQQEIILSKVQACQEDISHISDVFNGVRVNIKPLKWIGAIHVCIKGTSEPKVFNFSESAEVIAKYINDKTTEVYLSNVALNSKDVHTYYAKKH
jgi:hypothetical protein